MLSLLLGDLHFQNPAYNFATDKALSEIFKKQIWPLVWDRGIERIIQLGDFTHDKKQINKNTAQIIQECFIEPIKEFPDLEVILICGNHDAYFRNTNSINSLKTLFSNTNFKIVDTQALYDGKVIYIPWGLPATSTSASTRFAFMHAEVKGFEYQKGIVAKTGFDLEKDLNYYDKVFAGHFHKKSQQKNFMYLGSLLALNFGEVDSEHGFGIFDDETGKFEFIKTEVEVFKKLVYPNDVQKFEGYDFSNKAISIVVKEKQDEDKYNDFLKKIYEQKPIDVKILSIESELKNVMEIDAVEGIENVLALSKKYIEGMELKEPLQNNILYKTFEKVYEEAITT